ncbi:MAG: dTDP-4-dehydrorhamnose 3,5-epimerase [Herminiimonas sp.]|nr:dTDP-4-dehydrorhamnose 3,5-epimerase [Herminiimonas sp.]
MSNRFDVLPTPISGLTLLRRKPIGDNRGYLERMFCLDEFAGLTAAKNIVQINHTLTEKKGAVRGMHFQHAPYAETKYVSCLRGEVFDVAVDLRKDSATFLHWHAEILSAENHKTLVIPEGFAHGFQTLTENCEMLYLHTVAHRADAEGALNAKDVRLNIKWPLPIAEQSARDAGHAFISDFFSGVAG